MLQVFSGETFNEHMVCGGQRNKSEGGNMSKPIRGRQGNMKDKVATVDATDGA